VRRPGNRPPLVSRRHFLGAGGCAFVAALRTHLPAASRHELPAGIQPFAIAGDDLLVPAGDYEIGTRTVTVKTSGRLRIRPADIVTVRDEPLRLAPEKPGGFFTGTKLQGTLAKNIGAFRALIEDSLSLRDDAGRTLRRGDDYLVSAPFALLGLGTNPSVTPATPVFATYSHFTQRIDTIAVGTDGAPILLPGAPRLYSPEPASLPAGAVAIANVYRPFRATTLDDAHVFPIRATAAAAITQTNTGRVPKTLQKLRSGQPVTIVCWGDSITVGADVAPEDAWANRLHAVLKEKFPRSNITHRNHSIGGTKSAQWLHNGDFPGLPKQNPEKCRFDHVLAEKPDLVVMEFLNDIVFSEDVLRRTYEAIHEHFAARGIEWLIVTPSQKIPQDFNLAEMKDERPRLLDDFLRKFAAAKGCALADAAARWKHLYREGIPYFSLFNNAYNHPNAFGHRLFVEEIIRCIGA
jgi:hypothetical protein